MINNTIDILCGNTTLATKSVTNVFISPRELFSVNTECADAVSPPA